MANEHDGNDALLRAAQQVGGQAELARRLSVVAVTVNQWAKGRRPIPDDKCVAIELATGGEVVCEDLAPGRRWVRVADDTWPHPGGKPLLDFSPSVHAANDEHNHSEGAC